MLKKCFKKIYIIFFFLILNMQYLKSHVNLHEIFLEANQAYCQNNFAKAIDLYQKLNHDAAASAVVCYNLGNCYFAQQQYLMSINMWLKAYQIGSWRIANQSFENILVAQDLLKVNYTMQAIPTLRNYLFLWQILSLLLLSLLCLLYLKFKSWRNLIWRLIIFSELIMLVVVIWQVRFQSINYVAVQNSTSLVAGPDNIYHQLANVQIGEVFRVVRKQKDWYLVQGRGRRGWLEKKDLYIV